MSEPQDPALRCRVHEEICARMKPGAMALWVTTAGLFFFTDAAKESPRVAAPLLLLTMAVNVIRFVLSLSFRSFYPRHPRAWMAVFVGLGYSHAAVWGIGSGYLVVFHGLLWSSLTVMLVTAAMAAGACSSLAPDRKLMRIYIALLMLPALLFGLWVGTGRGTTIALMHAAYFAYLWFHGGQNNQVLLGLWRNERRLQDINAELGRAKDEALEALRAKSMFLANMSHEIRTPLNGVLGMAQMLDETRLDGDQRDMVRAIRRSGEHLMSLLGDILDATKVEAGRMVLDPVPVDLRACLAEVVVLLSPVAKRKGLSLQLRDGSAADSPPAIFLVDPLRLRQVVSNLLANALKFTETGGVTVTLSIDSAEPSDSTKPSDPAAPTTHVRVEVKDTGPGIPMDQSGGGLFDSFAQTGPATRRYGGTGLGLHISRGLVQLMGGTIGVDSRQGQGSTFWFELPLRRPLAPVTPSRLPAWQAGVAPPLVLEPDETPVVLPGTGGPRVARILIAEDNPMSQKVVIAMLRRLGCEVELAQDGLGALKRVEEDRFDLVLLDCQMPRMDGYQAADRIRSLPGAKNRVPIVALTANSMPGDELRCLQAGMDDFVAKPVRLQDLRAAIERWIGPLAPVRDEDDTAQSAAQGAATS